MTCLCPLQAALRARDAGSTRFCMGAAWRGPTQVGVRQWDRVLEMVKRIRCMTGQDGYPGCVGKGGNHGQPCD